MSNLGNISWRVLWVIFTDKFALSLTGPCEARCWWWCTIPPPPPPPPGKLWGCAAPPGIVVSIATAQSPDWGKAFLLASSAQHRTASSPPFFLRVSSAQHPQSTNRSQGPARKSFGNLNSAQKSGDKRTLWQPICYADTADTACECGTSEQTMQHLLRCLLLENKCSLEDLATANEKALHCARAWPNIWLNSEMMDTKEEDSPYIHTCKYMPPIPRCAHLC